MEKGPSLGCGGKAGAFGGRCTLGGTKSPKPKNAIRDSVPRYIVPRCKGVLGHRGNKRYRTKPSAIAKIAARPAAIAAHALHWLCSYIKRKSNLGSSTPVPKPPFGRPGFRNLIRADMNQRMAATAAKVSERTSNISFKRVFPHRVALGQQNPRSGICSSTCCVHTERNSTTSAAALRTSVGTPPLQW